MRKPGSTSLTAHLARAAGAESEILYLGSHDDAEGGAKASTTIVLEDDKGRCAHSAARGQRCSRRAGAGQTLCAGHAAMADSAGVTARSRRSR
jgi:hypothetical protein